VFNETNKDRIRVIDADPGDDTDLPKFELTSDHSRMTDIVVSPNGKWIAAAGWYEPAIQVWNLETKSLVVRLPHSDGLSDTTFKVQFSPDSRWLVCCALNADAPGLYIYETESWQRRQVIRGSWGPHTIFSKDGSLFCWQSPETGQLVLADPQSRVELARLPVPGNNHTRPVFSDDTRTLMYRKSQNAIGIIRLSQLQSLLSDLGLAWDISVPSSVRESPKSHTLEVNCGSVPDEYQTLVKIQEARRLSEQAWEDALAGDFRTAREKYSRSVVLAPEDDFALNNLAWLLVSCPDETLRDAKQALTLAQRAVALEPNDITRVNTLGVAQYRSEMWSDAIETLQRAESLDPGKYFAFNGFFIAMAQYKLGKHAEAKSWFDRSVEWMNQGHATDPELIRFHKEARDLIDSALNPGEQ
jgi:hypothetical protein